MTLSRYDIEQLQSELTEKLAKIEPTSAMLYPYGLMQLNLALKKESGKPSPKLRELGRLAKHTLEDFANIEHQEQVHPRYNVATCLILTKGFDLQKALKKSRTTWANAYEEALKQYPKSRLEVVLMKAAESLGIHDPTAAVITSPGAESIRPFNRNDRFASFEGKTDPKSGLSLLIERDGVRGMRPMFNVGGENRYATDEELDRHWGKQVLSSEDVLPH